jgi:hypothetical protein
MARNESVPAQASRVALNHAALFLHTLAEIEEAGVSRADFKILRASASLRQLLLDGTPLVDAVNRELRIKFRFEVDDCFGDPALQKLIKETCPIFYATLDALDPDFPPRRYVTRKTLTKDQLLSQRVILFKENYYTVHEVIDQCAHVLGGVHLGEPKTPSQFGLDQASKELPFTGFSIPIQQLISILRVVAKGLEPLKTALIRGATPG